MIEGYQNQSSRGVLQKKVVLKIWQNSQENICARVFLVPHACNVIKKRDSGAGAKFLRTPFLKNTSRRLFLEYFTVGYDNHVIKSNLNLETSNSLLRTSLTETPCPVNTRKTSI